MTLRKVLIFWSIVLAAGLALQQYWASFSPADKWLYHFEETAREYAIQVLSSPADSPVAPELLSKTDIKIQSGFVTFSPQQEEDLVLAFSPDGNPGELAGDDKHWRPIEGFWYEQE